MEGIVSITVVLADDHAIVREGIAAKFRERSEISILGQCSDGESALDMILMLRPDFAIISLQLPPVGGIDLMRRLRQAGCGTKLIVLSIVREESTIRELFRSGANGYILKDGPATHIFEAFTCIGEGGRYLTPLLRREVLETERKDPLALLSKREFEVFSLLVEGMRPKDIAKVLDISPKTVDTYRAGIMRKLDVDGIPGLVRFAIGTRMSATSRPC